MSETNHMKLVNAWHLSKVPYEELVFRSFMQARGQSSFYSISSYGMTEDGQERKERELQRIIRSSRMNKITIAAVVAVASCFPLIQFGYDKLEASLFMGVSLSLLMLFGYMILYEMQILPTLLNREIMEMLYILPISQKQVSLITTLSFIRTFDYILLGGILAPTIYIFLSTNSLFVAAVECIGAITSVLIACSVSIFLTKMFYGNTSKGVSSRATGLIRFSFTLIWGLLVMSLGFFYNYATILAPAVDYIIKNETYLRVMAFIFPFSFSTLITYGKGMTLTYAITAITLYFILSIIATRWALSTISSLAYQKDKVMKTATISRPSLRLKQAIIAYIIKDLKIATRNPSTAFLLAAPVIETIIVLLPLVSQNMINVASVLTGTFIGGMFSSFTALSLLSSEGTGLDYTRALPITPNVVIKAKALTATAAYVPIPIVFIILNYYKPLSDNSIYFVPLIATLAILTANLAEISTFIKSGHGTIIAFNLSSGLISFVYAFIVGGLLIGIPFTIYVTSKIILHSHSISLMFLFIASLAEFLIISKTQLSNSY